MKERENVRLQMTNVQATKERASIDIEFYHLLISLVGTSRQIVGMIATRGVQVSVFMKERGIIYISTTNQKHSLPLLYLQF